MVSEELLSEILLCLESVPCQFWACDGPTLEPVPMATCLRCEVLAKVRVASGLPARSSDDMTFEEHDEHRRKYL